MNGISAYRRPVLIWNPVAGKLRRDPTRGLDRAKAALERAGVAPPRILSTERSGHADDLARTAVQEGADLILVLSGDGTINEVANGLAHSGATMGVLPGGTANVLAMELGLGSHLETAVERLASSIPRPVALGRLRGAGDLVACPPRYFLLMFGAGLDARIVHDLDPGFKAKFGKLAYWLTGFGQITHRVEQLKARFNGQDYECGFALMSRVRNYGGDMEIATGASLLRDEFEIVTFEGSNPVRYAWYMVGVLLGRGASMRGVRASASRRAEVLSAAHLQIDGEYIGRGQAVVEIVPSALTLLVPPTYGVSHG